jgi:hypothetical protein
MRCDTARLLKPTVGFFYPVRGGIATVASERSMSVTDVASLRTPEFAETLAQTAHRQAPAGRI